MSTRASMLFKSATVMISVPAICAVPTTRSPNWEFNLLTVPVNGRIDGGFGEVGLGGIQLRLGDADLFDGAVQGGFGHVVRCLGRQEIGLGNQLVLEKRVVAFVFQVGLFQVGLGGVPVGNGGFVVGLGRIARGQVIVRPDFEQQVAFLTCWPSLTASSMISPETSGLILTWSTGSILPLATTTSVMLRRATFSLAMAIGGVLLTNLLATTPATMSRPRIEKRMIFLSLLLLLLLFAIFLKGNRQLRRETFQSSFPRGRRVRFGTGFFLSFRFVVGHVLQGKYTIPAE